MINNKKELKETPSENMQKENTCPNCGGVLKLRNGKCGNFYGCSNYPKCKYTKNI